MKGLKKYYNKKNISLEKLTEEYKQFCKQFSIDIVWDFPEQKFDESTFNKAIYNEEEFKQFIKDNVK